MYNQATSNPNYAGFSVRLAAYLVDHIILFAALIFVRLPFWFTSLVAPDFGLFRPILFKFTPLDIILYLLTATYFILTIYFSGTTLGKKLFRIKVVSQTGDKLGLVDIVYRETIGRYLSGLLFLGYFLIAVDKKKRGLHDILCDTSVVYSWG